MPSDKRVNNNVSFFSYIFYVNTTKKILKITLTSLPIQQDKSLWKALKNILKQKNKIFPLRSPDNLLTVFNIDNTNLFAYELKKRNISPP